MPAQEKTHFLGLNAWQGNEYVKRADFVEDNITCLLYTSDAADEL